MAKIEYQKGRAAKTDPTRVRPAEGVVGTPDNPAGYRYTASARTRAGGTVESIKIVRR